MSTDADKEREHCDAVAVESRRSKDSRMALAWRIERERAAARAPVEAEVAELRAEFAQYRKDQRPPGCQCTQEFGDSPCPAHPIDPDTELPYEPAKLLAQRDELMRGQPGMDAFNEIARLCGCPEWDYPGQLVRDVAKLAAERDQLRATVEPVEALPVEWLRYAASVEANHTDSVNATIARVRRACAAELAAALRGKGSS